MQVKGDEITFSSGKKLYTHRGMLSLNSKMELGYGADGEIVWPIPEGWYDIYNEYMSTEDMRELVDYMLGLWKKLGDSL